MKLKAGRFTAEGFTTGLAIELPSGLRLRTEGNLAFKGAKGTDKAFGEFFEFMTALKEAGFEIEDASGIEQEAVQRILREDE
jgi:hypothetical protein